MYTVTPAMMAIATHYIDNTLPGDIWNVIVNTNETSLLVSGDFPTVAEAWAKTLTDLRVTATPIGEGVHVEAVGVHDGRRVRVVQIARGEDGARVRSVVPLGEDHDSVNADHLFTALAKAEVPA